MAATQTLSQSQFMNDKTKAFSPSNEAEQRKTQSPVYIPPSEFRMKLLKRILSVDGTIDNKALKKLQRHSSDRALQANILFQNGDVGTLISFDRLPDNALFRDRSETEEEAINSKTTLPAVQNNDLEEEERPKDEEKKERPLKLPPIVLPPIYSMTPRPLVFRDYSGPPYVPPPVSTEEWEDLQDCRYLRPAMKKFREVNPDKNKLILWDLVLFWKR